VIGAVSLLRCGYFVVTSLSCGLAAAFLKDRQIGNWTWMAADTTFTKGMQVGMGLALINILADAIIRRLVVAINASTGLTDPNKYLVKIPVMFLSWCPQPVFFLCSGVSALSYATFFAISETVIWGLNPKPPFYCPRGWTQVIENPQGLDWRFELRERSLLKAWIAFTKEPWTKSLHEFQYNLLERDRNNGRASQVLRVFPLGHDTGGLISVTEPTRDGSAFYHCLAVVKNGFGFTLNVGSVARAEFDEYAELFDRILGSLRIGEDWVSLTEEKIKRCSQWVLTTIGSY
jgi:hypothetical protein